MPFRRPEGRCLGFLIICLFISFPPYLVIRAVLLLSRFLVSYHHNLEDMRRLSLEQGFFDGILAALRHLTFVSNRWMYPLAAASPLCLRAIYDIQLRLKQ